MKIDGYKEVIIPEIRLKVCNSCKYFLNKLARSGSNPQYKIDCTHPEAPVGIFYFGNLEDRSNGYVITPLWCPFKRIIERDVKINDIIED